MNFEIAAKAALLAVLLISAAACNTVKGLGEDIKSVGQAGERAID
jgi:entericidin B